MTSISDLLGRASELEKISDSPVLDTQRIICRIIGRDTSFLHTWPCAEITPNELKNFELLFARRLMGEPIAYLTGEQGFWSMILKVNAHTLIPRPETELLVEIALAVSLGPHASVLDLGTGSGSIALALASERSNWDIVAVEKNTNALAMAKSNGFRLRLKNVDFLAGDWFSPLVARRFHLIVSNPPYVAMGDESLDGDGVRFEPRDALVSGVDGLESLRYIISQSPNFLHQGGWLLVEHGCDQGLEVRKLFLSRGYSEVSTHSDLNHRERITLGCTKRSCLGNISYLDYSLNG